jgi:hypothetical protein
MRTRTLVSGVTLGVLLTGGGAGVYLAVQHGNGVNAAAQSQPPAVATAKVVRTDLSTTESEGGTLGYTGSHNVISQAHGTLTAIATEGSTVSRGQTLFEVDGSPVVLMYGSRPAWRTFSVGMSDGPDVKQLDENLIAMGYATTANLSPSDTYTSADQAAVKRWQKALGVDQTGTVQLGAVVFLPGPIRIASNKVDVGGAVQPGAPVSTATDTTRSVDVALDTSKQALVKVGEAVGVDLPNGNSVDGTISAIASVARAGQNGSSSTIDVTVSLRDQSKLGSLDQAPVDITIVTQSVKGVLAVPINALTVRAGGGYAVDVIGAGGTRHRVAVTTGLFSSSMVEVSGDGLQEGDSVEVPSV